MLDAFDPADWLFRWHLVGGDVLQEPDGGVLISCDIDHAERAQSVWQEVMDFPDRRAAVRALFT